MEYSTMNTKYLLSTYRKKKIEYQALLNELSYVDPDDEELKQMEQDIQSLKIELDGRENVKSKAENKRIRQLQAKKHKGGRRGHKNK